MVTQNLNNLSERVISLAYDVISHILETGPVSTCGLFVQLIAMCFMMGASFHLSQFALSISNGDVFQFSEGFKFNVCAILMLSIIIA